MWVISGEIITELRARARARVSAAIKFPSVFRREPIDANVLWSFYFNYCHRPHASLIIVNYIIVHR